MSDSEGLNAGEKIAVIGEKLTSLADTVKEMKEENNRQNIKILEQTTKTNGSVADIKEWKIKHDAELNMLKRGFKFIVLPVFVAVAVYLAEKVLEGLL